MAGQFMSNNYDVYIYLFEKQKIHTGHTYGNEEQSSISKIRRVMHGQYTTAIK